MVFCKVKIAEPKKGERIYIEFDMGNGWDCISAQHLVYIDGQISNGLDVNHKEIKFSKGGQHDIWLYAYNTMGAGKYQGLNAVIAVKDTETEGLYYDLLAPLQLCLRLVGATAAVVQLLKCWRCCVVPKKVSLAVRILA